MMNPWEKNWNTQSASAPWERAWSDQESENVTFQPSSEALAKIAENTAQYENKYKDVSSLKTGLKAMNGNDWLDVGGQALQGAERVADGASLGAYDWANRKLGGNYQERKEHLQQQADTTGVGGLNKVTGLGLELGGNIVGVGGVLTKGLSKTGLEGGKLAMASGGVEGGVYGATGSDTWNEALINSTIGAGTGVLTAGSLYGMAKPLVKRGEQAANYVNRWRGKRKLTNQLSNGDNFSDIDLGKISKNKLDEINNLRNIENADAIENNLVTIPADRVEHLYQQRILDNKYHPKEVGNVLDSAIFGRDSKVVGGKYPTLQGFVDDSTKPMNVAIVGKHRDRGSLFVKTGYKKDAGSSLEGRRTPSSDPDFNNPSGSLLSARQTTTKAPYADNINSNGKNVNDNEYSRSFVEALADRDKSKKIKNAVQAGADDLSEQARYLADQMAKRKDGMFDPELEKVIKTPELAKAEKAYADFFTKNGGKVLSPEKVANFYERNPIAKNILSEMKRIDPRNFDNIVHGSLAEFDMLKKILREEAGNKIRVGSSKAGAMKRAENNLKSLMDGEFEGFRDINRQFANARSGQGLFDSKLKGGLSLVGGATISPFWSGMSSPFASAGAIGGLVNPAVWALTAGGLGGKAFMRSMRRKSGRALAKGIFDEGLNPKSIKYLVGPGIITAKDLYRNNE